MVSVPIMHHRKLKTPNTKHYLFLPKNHHQHNTFFQPSNLSLPKNLYSKYRGTKVNQQKKMNHNYNNNNSSRPSLNEQGFQHTVSVRERIVNDEESTATLHEMVQMAHRELKQNNKYPLFHDLMNEVVMNTKHLSDKLKQVRRDELFSGFNLNCGSVYHTDDANQYDPKSFKESYTMDGIIEKLIVELLRFLAMKILLESLPAERIDMDDYMESAGGGGDGDNNSADWKALPYQKMPSSRNPQVDHADHLVPSTVLCRTWKALTFLPLTYTNVCTAMGCDGAVDFNVEHLRLSYGEDPVNVAVKRDRQNYRYTLMTYEKLYMVLPDEEVWTRLDRNDAEDRDDGVLDVLWDGLDSMAYYVQGVMGERKTKIPSSVRLR